MRLKMKKKYEPVDEKAEAIKQLLDLGVKVTATNGEIHLIEIDLDSHNVTTLETITGLKFKEVEK